MLESKSNQASSFISRVKEVFNETSPAYINFCLSYSGHDAPNLDQAFTYAEIGSRWGLAIASWAAIFPKGNFYAIEASPEQCQWLEKLKQEASLDNLKIINKAYDDLLKEDLPQLDYIILNGSYTRAGVQGRKVVKDFIQKNLKNGGIVYQHYISQPGWNVVEPLKEFLTAALRISGENNPAVTVMRGLNSLKKMREAGSLYFKNSNSASRWLDGVLNNVPPEIILDDIINNEQKPFAFSEIIEEMTEAGVTYVGSLDISNYLDALITPKEFLECLNQVAGSFILRETVKGLLYNITFRNDLFIKSPKAVDKAIAEDNIRSKELILCGEKAKMPEKINIRGVEVKPKAEIYDSIINALAEGPTTVNALMEKTGLDTAQTAQAVAILLLMGWAHPSPPDYSAEKVSKIKQFNLTLEEVLGIETFNQILSVYGNWRALSSLERLYIIAGLKEVNPENFILEVCGKRGWKVLKDNEEITDPEIAHQVVSEQLKEIKEASWIAQRFWGEKA